MFTFGRGYTRREIHNVVGGNMQSLLPTVNGRVVCVCLTKKMNPDGPEILLIGDKPKVVGAAQVFINQDRPIPVFIKENSNNWEYIGNFLGQKFRLREEGLLGINLAGREDIRMVLQLRQVVT